MVTNVIMIYKNFHTKEPNIMQQKEIVYERIYNDFLIRLCEGEFPKGSSIPSLTDLCLYYNVGKNTILKVLQMLKENKFITTLPGKVGQVLFDNQNLNQYLMDLPGFVCDKAVLLDYYYAIRVLFPSIYTYASLACKEEQLKKVKVLVESFQNDVNSSDDYIHLSIHMFSELLSFIDNQLIKKIVEITMRKTILPGALLCGHQILYKELMLQSSRTMGILYEALENKDEALLNDCWKKILTLYPTIFEKALDLGIFPDNASKKEINIFQEMDTDKCFILASMFRRKILSGSYAPGDLLPSISEAKKMFKVSTITIRKAYQILSEMGFVQTINGRGTEVIAYLGQKPSKPLQQVALTKKSGYLESLVFLEITCPVLVAESSHISFPDLRYDLNSPWNPDYQYSIATIFYHLFNGMNSNAILSIYYVNSNQLYWGTYLPDVPANNKLKKDNHQQCLKVIDKLEQGNHIEASSMLLSLLKTLYPA